MQARLVRMRVVDNRTGEEVFNDTIPHQKVSEYIRKYRLDMHYDFYLKLITETIETALDESICPKCGRSIPTHSLAKGMCVLCLDQQNRLQAEQAIKDLHNSIGKILLNHIDELSKSELFEAKKFFKEIGIGEKEVE